MTGPRLPARIDRATFERVLQRAAELQAAGRDIGDGLTEEEILALGHEVGIPETELRQALLEERTRHAPAEPTGLLDRWIAPADVVATRVVQGTELEILEALTQWLDRHEHFSVQRAVPGRVTFEPLDSLAGAMRKVGAWFDPSRGKAYLDKAELVTAVVTPLEAGFSHVTLAATLRRSRAGWVAGGSTLAALATGAGAIAVVIGAPEITLLAGALPGAAVGWMVARGYRGVADRARLGLERGLDALERRAPRPALPSGAEGSGTLARGVGNVVRDITREVRKAIREP